MCIKYIINTIHKSYIRRIIHYRNKRIKGEATHSDQRQRDLKETPKGKAIIQAEALPR